MNAVIITSDDDRDRFEVAEQLEELLEDSDHDISHLEINPGARHQDWEQGKPCPECGSTALDVVGPEVNSYRSEGGNFEFEELIETTGINIHYRCAQCETVLDGLPFQRLEL